MLPETVAVRKSPHPSVLRKNNYRNHHNLKYFWIYTSPFFFMTMVRLDYTYLVYLPI